MAEIYLPAERKKRIERAKHLPEIIQGGMGVAVSNWRLAGEVAGMGEMGIVSGSLIGLVLARRLQDGDPDGSMRLALSVFPDQDIARKIIDKYYLINGRHSNRPYDKAPAFNLNDLSESDELNMVGAFTEVWLAKELAKEQAKKEGRQPGPIGINILTKVELHSLSTLYGAMLAGADTINAGAGIPNKVFGALNSLAKGERASIPFNVSGSNQNHEVAFDPSIYPTLRSRLDVPLLGAIVSLDFLAKRITENEELIERPDYLVIENIDAAGHNPTPRSKKNTEDNWGGQPIWGDRDKAIIANLKELKIPFYLGGGRGTSEDLARAKAEGAQGLQVGSLFALSKESGFTPEIKDHYLKGILNGTVDVYTSSAGSPTRFPFKLALINGEMPRQDARQVCDIGALCEAYATSDEAGKEHIDYRCSAGPIEQYKNKGGKREHTTNKICLCNALMATVGLGQIRSGGEYREEPVVTLGNKAPEKIQKLIGECGLNYSARDVIEFLRG